MYNRYVRNDNGVYRRIPVPRETTAQHYAAQEREQKSDCGHSAVRHGESPLGALLGKDGLFSGILGKLKLDEIDSGDLLLLVLLFLLFHDGEDDELLIALGLLLIL